MEENNNKIMIATIVGVVMVFAAVAFYAVFNKIRLDEEIDNNSNNRVEQAVPLDINSELVLKLRDYVSIHDPIFYGNSKVDLEILPMPDQYEMAFKELEKDGIFAGCDLNAMSTNDQSDGFDVEECSFLKYEIPEQNLEKAMKKVLGDKATPIKTAESVSFYFSTKWKLKDLSLQKDLAAFQENSFASFYGSKISYDATKKAFVGNYIIKSEDWDDGIVTKIESASKTSKRVSITEKIIFVDIHPNTPDVLGYPLPTEYMIFSDYNHSKQIGTISIDDYEAMLQGSSDKGFDTLIDTYTDKAMTVVYIFEENVDGSYHFVSSEIK